MVLAKTPTLPLDHSANPIDVLITPPYSIPFTYPLAYYPSLYLDYLTLWSGSCSLFTTLWAAFSYRWRQFCHVQRAIGPLNVESSFLSAAFTPL